MIDKDFDVLDIFVIQNGNLVIYRDGQRVAEFEPDVFPSIILALAKELRHPTKGDTGFTRGANTST